MGESVLNEIDWDLRKANFRIAIFHPEECGKGIGSWAIENTLEFAFQEINLHRVELDVFSFNPRAIRAYEKAGFQREGVLRDAVKDGEIMEMISLCPYWRRNGRNAADKCPPDLTNNKRGRKWRNDH